MSIAHRSIARLPLTVFDIKKDREHDGNVDHGEGRDIDAIRRDICSKLKSMPRNKSSRSSSVTESVSTVGELLQQSPVILLRALDPLLTYDECLQLIENTSVQCAPEPVTAWSLLRSMKDESTLTHIPTSLSLLDAHMRGGIRLGSITEVVGHAGAGKTQFAMQLAVNAARFRKGSIYIDTEQKLNLPRLRAIAAKRNQQQSIQQHPSESATTNENINNETPYINEQQVLANVTVHAPHSTEELLSVLSSVEDEIVARNCPSPEDINTINRFPVSVLILDSIAAPARRDFGSGSAPQRAAAVIQSAQILKRLADQWNLCILVINQVGTTADSNHDNKLSAGIGEDIARGATAALGTSWHHCVSTRIHLKQEPATDHDHHSHRTDQQTSPPLVRRRCSIVKSNVVGSAEFAFAVSDLGIVDV